MGGVVGQHGHVEMLTILQSLISFVDKSCLETTFVDTRRGLLFSRKGSAIMAAANLVNRTNTKACMRTCEARDATSQLLLTMMTFTRQNAHQPLKKGPFRVENPKLVGLGNIICVASAWSHHPCHYQLLLCLSMLLLCLTSGPLHNVL